jgi:protein-arginine kinase activator protein McsA
MVDVIALIAEKRKAVEEENFERAAEIKKELDTVDVTALAAEKAQAVADENYMRAAELKKIIESLTIESHSSSSGDPSSSPTKLSSSPSPSKTPTASNNPIKSDPYLSALIGSLDDIQNHKQFKKWRSSFLEKFESFLSQEGSKPAQTAYDNFRKHMVSFVKKVTAVEKFVEKGDISVERTTVKGRNSLNELDKQLKEIILDCAELIPSTNAEETKRGASIGSSELADLCLM